jgi:RNA polymerase sigma factor (sigma-70 family)
MIDETINAALKGNKEALRTVVNIIQKDIYNLSLRFLWIREDAEDATQEILVKVITNLSNFKGNSKFSTWTYRVAVNHLLNFRKNKLEQHLSFSSFGDDIINGLHSPPYTQPDKDLLAEEVKIGCTLGMLICLDRSLRIAYILGEVFELTGNEGAEVLQITPENFRKRLSLARSALQGFMTSYCGLVHKKNPCRCGKRINYAIDVGRINKAALNFARPAVVQRSKEEMEQLYTTSAIFKSHPSFEISRSKAGDILGILGNLKELLK